MAETLNKLQPDRDLQCFFLRPSAIASLSQASPSGFTVSGTWRQQFDWCVIEWNRNNVYEHPALRSLPDGDLSGLVLSYEETRQNCIPMESDLYHTVDWDALRIWTRDENSTSQADQFYRVKLYTPDKVQAVEGSFVPASAEFILSGTITAGDHIGLGCMGEGWDYQIGAADTLSSAVDQLANIIELNSSLLSAVRTGTATLTVYYRGAGYGVPLANSTTGANGNRVGAYVYVQGAQTETWSQSSAQLSGGQSPTKWRVTINFNGLKDENGAPIDTANIRKMRWTYAADLQPGAYQRGEFQVQISNWTVTGTGRGYQVAGPVSWRIEDTDPQVTYAPDSAWTTELGNYSGGTIRYTSTTNAAVSATYQAQADHTLYLGTRFLGLGTTARGADISVQVDSLPARTIHLWIDGEDQLVRMPLGNLAAGAHQVSVTNISTDPSYQFYFDFFEICVPTATLPEYPIDNQVTLATDWDTDHSIALAPERTAWFVNTLGYHGRANHYVGALWFYELYQPGQVYASGTLTFSGAPPFSSQTTINIGGTQLTHTNLIGDTAASVAKAFEQVLNQGSTAIWAQASGAVLTIYARQMGAAGNLITISATPTSGAWQVTASGATLSSGVDGNWRTDLTAMPRLNRAVRDWCQAYFTALHGYGIAATAAFSTELQHGDPSLAAGIAQRYPDGSPVLVNTPAVQTNFSPTSLAYWQQVHLEMAQIMVAAGVDPYLQFGEVQWWYFPEAGVGMTFYDAYTASTFQSTYGRPMDVILSNDDDPAAHPQEAVFLPSLIGAFTQAASAFVRAAVPNCKFEVLYPLDVNNFRFTRVINYAPDWTPANLTTIKTESFGFTSSRNLDNAVLTVDFGAGKGFAPNQRAFLVGVGDSFSSWMKEVEFAKADNVESIVLWALDQYCLVGYATPLVGGFRRSTGLGN